jgi:hypothetical protein
MKPFSKSVPAVGWNPEKFATYYDAKRKRIYYANIRGFFAFDLDGNTVFDHLSMFADGPNGKTAQYPHFTMDGSTLYLAWTTSAVKGLDTDYYDIHWMASYDGGLTWRVPGGATIALPVVVDDTGPASVVAGGGYWLKTFISSGAKLHFAFGKFGEAEGIQHYVRFNQANAKKEFDTTPVWQGSAVRVAGGDGFFVKSTGATAPLYAVMHTSDNRIGILASDDSGTTWYDYARSEPLTGFIYALSGARSVSNGHIVGHLTLGNNSVWSFRVPAKASSSSPAGLRRYQGHPSKGEKVLGLGRFCVTFDAAMRTKGHEEDHGQETQSQKSYTVHQRPKRPHR